MARKNSNRATRDEILALARKRLEKTFNPRHNPTFKRLYVKVSPYDDEYGFWPVSIRAKGVKNPVGDMEFYQAGGFKKCSWSQDLDSSLDKANKLNGKNNVSESVILHQAKLHLSRNFDPVVYPDFAHLSVRVEPFDPEYGYWRASIYVRFGKVEEFVGHMNFSKKGISTEMTHQRGVIQRLGEVKERSRVQLTYKPKTEPVRTSFWPH
jgi:hypothetical protein